MTDLGGTLGWLDTWNAQISTVAGAFASLFGVFALFTTGASCKFAGVLQIITGLVVVAIEGPNFLPQLAFAAPMGAIFEGRPEWIKLGLYAAMTIVPAFAGCFRAFLLGFVASVVVTVTQALLFLGGRRAGNDEMQFRPPPPSSAQSNDHQPYSTTSP